LLGVKIDEAERRLGDVYRKFKNPYGNYEVIDRFMKSIYSELSEAELEERIEKKVKINPPVEQEINNLPQRQKFIPEQPVAKVLPPVVQPPPKVLHVCP
jgi:hypothetical protein